METQRAHHGARARLDAGRVAGGEDDDGGLTEAGWPRERVDGWPIPWLSPRYELSQTDETRLQAAATGGVCAVCGLGYQADEKALILTSRPPDLDLEPGDIVTPKDGGLVTAIDNGVLHRRCARLALAWCPRLKQVLADGELVCLEVVAHATVPQFLDLAEPPRGKLMLTATFTEGEVVALPL